MKAEGGASQTFYGAGHKYKINANEKVTVTTQFITADGTDSGKLSEVKQFYSPARLIACIVAVEVLRLTSGL